MPLKGGLCTVQLNCNKWFWLLLYFRPFLFEVCRFARLQTYRSGLESVASKCVIIFIYSDGFTTEVHPIKSILKSTPRRMWLGPCSSNFSKSSIKNPLENSASNGLKKCTQKVLWITAEFYYFNLPSFNVLFSRPGLPLLELKPFANLPAT